MSESNQVSTCELCSRSPSNPTEDELNKYYNNENKDLPLYSLTQCTECNKNVCQCWNGPDGGCLMQIGGRQGDVALCKICYPLYCECGEYKLNEANKCPRCGIKVCDSCWRNGLPVLHANKGFCHQ